MYKSYSYLLRRKLDVPYSSGANAWTVVFHILRIYYSTGTSASNIGLDLGATQVNEHWFMLTRVIITVIYLGKFRQYICGNGF